MRILVIGGAGYIGGHVAREFLDSGHEVTVFDNLSTGTKDNLFPDARFVEGDIHDYPAISEAMRGVDAVIHLAAAKAAGESMLDPGKYSVQNLCGSVNILNAAVEAGVRRLVFSSSAAAYGEPKYLPIDEKHPTEPENYYGFTKLESASSHGTIGSKACDTRPCAISTRRATTRGGGYPVSSGIPPT
jgi:UDP-glucose 4-epimerase